MQALDADKVVGRAEKQRIRSDRNGAFNAFLHQFAGDPRVARILLNCGFTTVTEWDGLMQELRQYILDPAYAKTLDRQRSQAQLKQAAHAARERFRAARRSDQRFPSRKWSCNTVSVKQESLLTDIFTLRQQMIEANKAYGYGVGSEAFLSVQEQVAIEYTTMDLRKYFST